MSKASKIEKKKINQLFWKKKLSGIPSECQTVWIQIRTDILSGLILVQTVCKDCQLTTLVGKELMGYLRCRKLNQCTPSLDGIWELINRILQQRACTRPLLIGHADTFLLVFQVIKLFFKPIFLWAAILTIENVALKSRYLYYKVAKTSKNFFNPSLLLSAPPSVYILR